MGGGKSSSAKVNGGSRKGNLRELVAAYGNSGTNQSTGQWNGKISVTPEQLIGNYTDNGNEKLIKWQNQDDDKRGSFLAKVDNQTDLAQIRKDTNDPWTFYNNPMQKFNATIGLNERPQVLNAADFEAYLNQTGATRLYRAWSGADAFKRFKESPNNHNGNGVIGDGYYYSPSQGKAKGYGTYLTEGALSPNARIVSLDAVNNWISSRSPKLQSALRKAGAYGTRTYGSNEGQAQAALAMGFNAIDAGNIILPLNGSAVIVKERG